MAIGERIRFMRGTRRMKQSELARRARMAPEQINRYEMGRSQPTMDTAVRIARALGVPLSDLIT